MAKGGSRKTGRGRDASARRSGGAKGAKGSKAVPSRKGTKSSSSAQAAPRKRSSPASANTAPGLPAAASGSFRLGAIPGATPGKWIDTWNERMPRTPLELVPVAFADQRRALVGAEVDAALVRLPIEKDGLHLIALYDEIPVVVCARDSHLTAADELDADDLAGEVLIVPQDDVLGVRIPGTVTPSFAPPADTEEAIATVAAGVGIVVVPMSLARLHHRKDADYRPLRGGRMSTVALAWPAERTTAEVETFIGIVRGRTANSSRG